MARKADMKYLASRAKKMCANLGLIPSPSELRHRFARKGTELTPAEAKELTKAVREHQRGGATASTRKPRAKREVSSGRANKRRSSWGK